jgi:hypothetical protein
LLVALGGTAVAWPLATRAQQPAMQVFLGRTSVGYIRPPFLVPVAHNGNASMNEQRRPECVVEAVPEDPSHPDGATDMYLIFDGRRIAKRGKPGTPHAMTWISLEPGVVVRDVPMPESESGWGMVIEINNVRVH